LTGINRLVIPFISCGDLSGFDSDQTYELDQGKEYKSLEATTAPVDPPYKKAKELRKDGRLDASAVVIIEKTTTATSTMHGLDEQTL
jgi:tRNA (cytidine32/guanosine34-2'-O)-methyltransferase